MTPPDPSTGRAEQMAPAPIHGSADDDDGSEPAAPDGRGRPASPQADRRARCRPAASSRPEPARRSSSRPGRGSSSASASAGPLASTSTLGAPSTTTTVDPRNIIQIENANPGTSDFAVRMEQPWVDMLHAWCDHDSAHRGETVTIYATTKAADLHRRGVPLRHLRRRDRAEDLAGAGPIAGTDQPPPTVDPATNMRSCAHWSPSFSVLITRDWTPGMYMFRLIGRPTAEPRSCRSRCSTTGRPTCWSCRPSPPGTPTTPTGERASTTARAAGPKVVTFDRPYHASGSGHFFGGEYELVQLVESMGIDVAYTTNIDLHARPEQIEAGGYKAVVTPGPRRVLLGADPTEPRGGPRPGRQPHLPRGQRRVPPHPARALRPRAAPARGQLPRRPARTRCSVSATRSWSRPSGASPPAAQPEASLIGNYYESNPVTRRHGGHRPGFVDLRRHRAGRRATGSSTWCRTSTTG